jgi:hypothetical protein
MVIVNLININKSHLYIFINIIFWLVIFINTERHYLSSKNILKLKQKIMFDFNINTHI